MPSTLGRTAVDELRYQGERKGWDATQIDTTVRRGLSDLYASAVEQAIGQDPNSAEKLYAHARDAIQPERQAVVERKMERAREEPEVAQVGCRHDLRDRTLAGGIVLFQSVQGAVSQSEGNQSSIAGRSGRSNHNLRGGQDV